MTSETNVKPSARPRVIFIFFGFGGCRLMDARRKRLTKKVSHCHPGEMRDRDQSGTTARWVRKQPA